MSDGMDLAAEVAAYFDERSATYDTGDFHPRLTERLIEIARIEEGQNVLDAATGTGLVAIEVARRVGASGRVVGIDISSDMLAKARRKTLDLALTNVEFYEGDASTADFGSKRFDVVLCSAALVFMADIPAVLRNFYRLLKPGGYVGFDAPAENSTVAGSTLASIAARHGVSLGYTRLYTQSACRQALTDGGFELLTISTEVISQRMMPLTEVDPAWSHILNHPLSQPLRALAPQALIEIRDEFQTTITSLATPAGIDDRNVMNIALGVKLRSVPS